MKLFILSVIAMSCSVAVADDLDIPACASSCFQQAVAQTTCGLTDFYCQCTTGAQKITQLATQCLCQSTCSTTDLYQAYTASSGICQKAIEAHGDTYQQPPPPNIAEACAGTATSSSAAASGSATAQASVSPSASGSGAAGHSGNATATSSAAVETQSTNAAAGSIKVLEGVVLGIVGLAAFAL